MLYIFEMANNHQGSVKHAKLIVDKFAELAKNYKISAGVKLQFRQLGTFIHKNYANSDLKYVKRFNETKLTKKQFAEIVDYIKSKKLVTIATPFDNESLPWLEDLDVSVVKIASCSIDDWPLLRKVCKINKRIILSTGGTSIEQLRDVYELFKKNKRDFAFMHCVGEYPTPIEKSDLSRIQRLKKEFPDIEIGFSTHESPKQKSLASHAVALGCTILEKHVGVETEEISLNAYSCTPTDMENVVKEIQLFQNAFQGRSSDEKEALRKLKRGIYVKRDVKPGSLITMEDLYFAMPLQEGQLDASEVDAVLGENYSNCFIEADSPVLQGNFVSPSLTSKVKKITDKIRNLLEIANVTVSRKDVVELSSHYGIDNFEETGVFIVNRINREYCKKLLVVLPGQQHPTHHHIKKEEAFELLDGDCLLILNDKEIALKKGQPVLIARGVKHSFKSVNGCVIEEISTTHYPGDSVYEDPNINKLSLSERKLTLKNWKINV